MYPKTKVPYYFRGDDDHAVTAEDVMKVASLVNRTSSPGTPWVVLCKDKGQVVDDHSSLLVSEVLSRLRKLADVDLFDVPEAEDPVWLVQQGYCDPVRLFVKNEPHSLEKISEGRLRLISSVSITDEVIERLLFEVQNNAEIDHWVECPSKPGIGLAKDEQAAMLYEALRDLLVMAAESDVSGWDWNVKDWMLALDARVRVALAEGAGKLYARLVCNRMWCLARSVFSLSDGRLIAQRIPGIMKSGSYVTSSTNSRMRVALALLTGALWAIAMGDDCVEQWRENAAQEYARFGIKVKVFQRVEGGCFEFCSHSFTPRRIAIFLNMAKATYRLLSNAPDEQRLAQYKEITRHSPDQAMYLAAIDQVWGYLTTLPEVSPHVSMPRRRGSNKAKVKNQQNSVSMATAQGRGDYKVLSASRGAQLDRIEGKVDKIAGKASGLGAGVGRALGSLLGQGDLGATVGGMVGKYTGLGDYRLPKVNSLIKLPGQSGRSTSIPLITNGKRGVVFRESEFLGDIVSSSVAGAFNNQVFRVNPADPATFPWLALMAPNFDQWEPLGLVVRFVSTSASFGNTGQQLGTVILAANYDPQDAPYASKQAMETADYAISTKASESVEMGMECDPRERATRLLFTAAVKAASAAEQRTNDLATIEVGTQGCGASQTLGELWLDYDIAFYKKQLGSIGDVTTLTFEAYTLNCDDTRPMGTAALRTVWGSLPCTINENLATRNQIVFPPTLSSGFFDLWWYIGDATGVTVQTGSLFQAPIVNCQLVAPFVGAPSGTTPQWSGSGGLSASGHCTIQITGSGASFYVGDVIFSGGSGGPSYYRITKCATSPLTPAVYG